MSLLDGALRHPSVLELSAHRRMLLFSRGACRSNDLSCHAKIAVDDDDEQKHVTTRKGFSIRVPTMPKLGDIESARRMLEFAFQALSFEMPRIPVDSALQGLTFAIFKSSILKRGLAFDITGFVATKFKKPPKDVEGAAVVEDEAVYARCLWPRMLKEANVEALSVGSLENLQDQKRGVNLAMEASTSVRPQLRTTHRSPKKGLSNDVELSKRPLIPSSVIPVGPYCAWPRKTHRPLNAGGALNAQSISSNVQYPRSAWPRSSLSGRGVVPGGNRSPVEVNMGSAALKEEVSPCSDEGGPRCAWPRKALPAKKNGHNDESNMSSEDLSGHGLERGKAATDGEVASADYDGAAELPRRMLATSVGLSLMNQLVKGSIATSFFDFCSLLPAGYTEIAEEENAALGIGRRTLLVFINKHSSG